MEKTFSNEFSIEEQTILRIPHCNWKICFSYPPKTDGTFFELRRRAYSRGVFIPTGGELVSLLYIAAQNNEKEPFKDIISLLRKGPMYIDDAILRTQKGLYVKDHPKIKEKNPVMVENELGIDFREAEKDLEKLVYSPDGSVRYISMGNEYGIKPVSELPRIRIARAILGIEGRSKLVETLKLLGCNNVRFIGELTIPIDEQAPPELRIGSLFLDKNDVFVIAGKEYNNGEAKGSFVPVYNSAFTPNLIGEIEKIEPSG